MLQFHTTACMYLIKDFKFLQSASLFSFTHCVAFSIFWRSRQSLKVREHKVFGPYVDGLSQLAVTSFEVSLSPVCHHAATRNEAISTLYQSHINMIYNIQKKLLCIFSRQTTDLHLE